MKAAVIDSYGPASVLTVRDVPRPAPGADQVLVETHASSVNPIDWKIRNGSLKLLMRLRFPLILGYDVSGRVVEAGPAVRRFKAGDDVFARVDSKAGGAYAEYVAVGEGAAALKPKGISHEDAAAIPLAGLTALQALRDLGNIRAGGRVLVNGASGGVGVYAVQIAKALGAQVTAACGTSNIAWVEALGADRVVDYEKEDVLGDEPYDIVFDAVASLSYFKVRKALTQNGVYISTLPGPGLVLASIWTRLVPGRKARFVLMKPSGDDLAYLTKLIDEGKMRSVIDSTFPLEDIAAAHARSEDGHARGKIVIRVK